MGASFVKHVLAAITVFILIRLDIIAMNRIMDKRLSELFSGENIKLCAGLLLGAFVTHKLLAWGSWKVKNARVMEIGRRTREARDSKFTKFDTKGIDVERILSLDLTQLRKELMAEKVTSVQLVNVFGERC